MQESSLPGGTGRLPPEIMTNIFVLSMPEHALPSKIQAPLNVSHTCRLWRGIALSSVRLWTRLILESNSYISIRGPHGLQYGRYGLQIMLDILKAWLQRSQKATLDYSIDLKLSWASGKLGQLTETMISLLSEEQSRWERMELRFNCWASPTFSLKLADMRSLLALTLAYDLFCPGASTDLKIDISSSPRIQYLDPQGIIAIGDTIASDLTILRLAFNGDANPDTCLNSCFSLLQRAPNLASLSLSSPPPDEIRIVDRSISIVLPHLKELQFEETSTFYREILRTLTLPALKKMYLLWYEGGLGDDVGRVVYDFLHRSRPPLEKLHYVNDLSNDPELIHALELLPTLKSLFVEKDNGDGDIEDYLSDTFYRRFALEGPDALCPHLQELTIFQRRWRRDSHDLIVEMLLSRWRRVGSFQAELRGMDEGFIEGLLADARLKHCIEEGLVLRCFTYL